jgi:hypothetical protein
MEQWEIEAREKLDKEVPNGLYNIGSDKQVCYTGRQGYIEFQIEMMKYCRNDFKITEEPIKRKV